MKQPTHLTVEAWVKFLRTHKMALSFVETALKNANLPPLAWYDVLLELERVGVDGIRPFELKDVLLLPQYGLSRLLDRIETAGYLKRTSSEEDGRGQRLFITPSGRAMRRRMWSIYGQAIEDIMGNTLTQAQTRTLCGLLAKLAESEVAV